MYVSPITFASLKKIRSFWYRQFQDLYPGSFSIKALMNYYYAA